MNETYKGIVHILSETLRACNLTIELHPRSFFDKLYKIPISVSFISGSLRTALAPVMRTSTFLNRSLFTVINFYNHSRLSFLTFLLALKTHPTVMKIRLEIWKRIGRIWGRVSWFFAKPSSVQIRVQTNTCTYTHIRAGHMCETFE